MGYLAIVDRAYRGSVESQFFDACYGILALHHQAGPVEVVLRGSAVTTAVARDTAPRLAFGDAEADDLPDPGAGVPAMLGEGIAVYVDEPALHALGLDADALLPGVTCLDSTELAARWGGYDGVWFL